MHDVITVINEKLLDQKDGKTDEKAIRAVLSIYRDINASFEFRAIRAIRQYNKVLSEMINSLVDVDLEDVRQRVRPYPDVDQYELDVHLVEKDYIDVEFQYDGHISQVPVEWLADETWEKAVETTAMTRIEACIGRIKRRKEADLYKKLNDRKAKLLKEMESIDKSLGDL